MKGRLKSIVKYSLSIAIAALCIWMVVRKVNWTSFLEGLRCTRWGYIALFLLASILALVFRSLRWKGLLDPVDCKSSLIRIWDSINVGNLANVALPGIGEFLRCGLVAGKGGLYERALGTIVMERVWDVIAIVVLFAAALSLNWNKFSSFFAENVVAPLAGKIHLGWILPALVVTVALFVWLVWHFKDRNSFCAKIAKSVSGIVQGLGSFFKMKNKLVFAFYTAAVWAMYILMSWFGLKAVPELAGLGFVDAIFISAIGNIASVIPVPSGMGPYHYLVTTTLAGLYSCPQEIGLVYSMLCHETHAVLIIALGAISYAALSLRKKK